MRRSRLLQILILLLIVFTSLSLTGCGQEEPKTPAPETQQPINQEKTDPEDTDEEETSGIENLLLPTVTYLESLSEIGEVSEGVQLWYDLCRKQTEPAFYRLDDSFAEEGMTAYLFCQLSEAEEPVKVTNYETAGGMVYLDIETGWKGTEAETEPREVLAVIQADKTLDVMYRNLVNDQRMELFLSYGAEHMTVGHVDWSFLLDAAEGNLAETVVAEINRLFEASCSFSAMTIPNPNGLHCFMTSLYDDIEDLDFAYFLRHFVIGSDFEEGDIEALQNSEGWKELWGEGTTIDDIPVPVHRYAEEDINSVLEFYAGVDISALDTGDVLHVGNAYYNFVSDFGPGSFVCESGIKDGRKVVLKSAEGIIDENGNLGHTEICLEETDGRYLIKSHRAVPEN